jgi:hypothetical protein
MGIRYETYEAYPLPETSPLAPPIAGVWRHFALVSASYVRGALQRTIHEHVPGR